MIPGPFLAIAILASTALGLVTWDALAKPGDGRKGDLPFALALAALGLAFGAWSWTARAASPPWIPALLADDLARFLGALFLGLSGLCWLGKGAERGLTGSVSPAPRSPSSASGDGSPALFLLATCGGLIAISAADLLTLWVGLGLYALARRSARPGWEEGTGVRAILGLAASLFGLAALYASTGTSELIPLGRYLWEHGGPRPAILYVGASLALGGIALVAEFLPPYEPEAPEGEAPTTTLGVALLARLCLYPLGALSWEWSLALIWAAIGVLAWACTSFILRAGSFAQLWRWAMAQKGFLLLALGLAFHEQGLVALFMALPAYGLAQVILPLSLGWLRRDGAVAPSVDALKGLLRSDPWLGGPLCASIMTFMGMPATLGFMGRVRLLWAAQVAGLPGLVVVILLVSGLCGSAFLPLLLALLGKGSQGRLSCPFPRPLRLTTALAALGLVALGLYPQPLLRWALHVVETGLIR